MPFLFNNANMYIDQYNGIIGIGTNTANANLHVIGSGLITGNLSVSGTTSISSIGTLNSLNVNTGLSVLPNGNVGIGTATPIANLHVVGPVNFISTTGPTGMYIRTGNVGIGTTNPIGNLHVLGYTQILGATGATGMYVNTLGNIGIGINNPGSNLHVLGTTQLLSNTGATGLYVNTIGNIGIGTTNAQGNLHVLGHTRLLGSLNTTGLYVHNNGNVGIGTSIPNANLHVFGTAQITGTIGNSGLFIDNIGEVGINTSAPTSNLHVLGTTQLLNTTGTTGLYVNTIGNIGIGTNNALGNLHVLGHTRLLGSLNTTGLYVHNNGNVGLGTSVPNANLHVLGTSIITNITGTGIYVNASGNVGIGTTIGNAECHVQGQVLSSHGFISMFWRTPTFIPNGSQGAMMGWNRSGGNAEYNLVNVVPSSTFQFANFEFASYIISSQTYTSYGAWSGRGIGIGTTSPSANLHVFTGATSTSTIAANIGGAIMILNGANDGLRFIAAAESSLSAGSSRFITFGQSGTLYNQGEIFFHYAGNNSTGNYLGLGLWGVAVMFVTGAGANGRVGIGTTAPTAPLHVHTGGASYSGTSKVYFGASSNTLLTNGGSATNVSIICQGDLINVSGNFVSYSDVRIKNNIVSIPSNYCLELLLQLRVVEHTYIDNFKFPKKKINFIAQEVEEVLPLAVETTSDFLPSIFSQYNYTKITTNKYSIANINFDFITIGTKLKILTEEKEYTVTVYNIIEDCIFIESEKEITSKIFVYGHQVSDLRTLNNDTLYTICIGAVQENSKRIQKLETKLRLLEEKINVLI